jgi:YihY family inner membrane protein
MAGAIAYYALLSLLPLLILAVMLLSGWVNRPALMGTLTRYLPWIVPEQSADLLVDVDAFLNHGLLMRATLLLTLLFFSSLAFTALEKSMAVIFSHRKPLHSRHFLVSAILPYGFVACLALALLVLTAASVALESMVALGIRHPVLGDLLASASPTMLYLGGLGVELLLFTTLYAVMPAGRIPLRLALLGGLLSTALWELIRHGLVWYFSSLSKVTVVYGSLSTAVIALFSMELAAIMVLLVAQVIAEYEQWPPK